MNASDIQRIPLQLSQSCIVASIQIELTAEVLQQFRQDLLDQLHKTRSRGVILDLSGVEIIDLQDFETLRRTLSMAAIMGVETIITGLQAGVVSALVDLNADIDNINVAFDLDDALQLMNNLRPLHQDADLLLSEESEPEESEPEESEPEESEPEESEELQELKESYESDKFLQFSLDSSQT